VTRREARRYVLATLRLAPQNHASLPRIAGQQPVRCGPPERYRTRRVAWSVRLTWPLFIACLCRVPDLHGRVLPEPHFRCRCRAAGALNPLLGRPGAVLGGRSGWSKRCRRLHGARRHSELPATYWLCCASTWCAGLVVSLLLFGLHPYLPGWLGLRGASEGFGKDLPGVLGGFQFLKAVQLAYVNMLIPAVKRGGDDRSRGSRPNVTNITST